MRTTRSRIREGETPVVHRNLELPGDVPSVAWKVLVMTVQAHSVFRVKCRLRRRPEIRVIRESTAALEGSEPLHFRYSAWTAALQTVNRVETEHTRIPTRKHRQSRRAGCLRDESSQPSLAAGASLSPPRALQAAQLAPMRVVALLVIARFLLGAQSEPATRFSGLYSYKS